MTDLSKKDSMKNYEELIQARRDGLVGPEPTDRPENHCYWKGKRDMYDAQTPLLLKAIEALDEIGCNETFHSLGGIDDCVRCKTLAEIEKELKGEA